MAINPDDPVTENGRKLEQALADWLSASRRAYTASDDTAVVAERKAWIEVSDLIAAELRRH